VTWKGWSCPGFRLPMEVEWEYACRAGKPGARYGKLADVAWYDGNSDGSTHAVRGKQPNAWGLYDTLGNVWEWCWDQVSGSNRVFRGGSWGSGAQDARAACRYDWAPDGRAGNLGFRLAKSLP